MSRILAILSILSIMSTFAAALPVLTPRPMSVAGVASPTLDLNGDWGFSPADDGSYKSIRVPGEWAMQGFTVENGSFACYRRSFIVPEDWKNMVVKLRFDAVHAVCKVSVNGKEIGSHEGGFVPFELDATAALKPGANELTVRVQSESIADSVACMSQYASHQVGGILRKVTLFCVPQAHIAELWHETRLTGDAAEVWVHTRHPGGIPITHRLLDADGNMVATATGDQPMRVSMPKLWTSETPYLYTLVSETGAETVRQRIGLREVKVNGNKLLVNGSPVKLMGVNRHEIDPRTGRSISPELCRKDAELFRAANVNLVRTSHYPPSEEFLTACDELGIFVECEAAVCWIEHPASPVWKEWDHLDRKFLPYLLQASLDNVAANRNHPSVIIWSIANESKWSPLFAEVLDAVKKADPTRPVAFHDQCWGDFNNAGSKAADLANYHYPSEEKPDTWSQAGRPVWFGEYAHVQCYNRRELVTDPGIRSDWGRPLARMVDLIWQQPGCVGGAIWSGIDDVFQMPDGSLTGYGHWGPIDGLRRQKPEYHGMRAAYTPVRFLTAETPTAGPLVLTIQNRYNFTNLSAVKLAWKCGEETGIVALDLPPHAIGKATLASKEWKPGAAFEITATNAEGRVVGSARYSHPETTPFQSNGQPFKLSGDRLVAAMLALDIPAPMMLPLNSEGGVDTVGGTKLSDNILPFTPLPEQWTPVLTKNADGSTTAAGETADVSARITFTPAATGNRLRVDYELTLKKDINPRQWGLVFTVPQAFDTLVWNRHVDGEWLPADGIDRREGSSTPAAAGDAWRHDPHPMGCADFRSTRSHISRAMLTDAKHGGGLQVLSPNASQSIRAWVDGKHIHLLVAGYNTGGSDSFFSPHYAAERKPLKAGQTVKSSFDITP